MVITVAFIQNGHGESTLTLPCWINLLLWSCMVVIDHSCLHMFSHATSSHHAYIWFQFWHYHFVATPYCISGPWENTNFLQKHSSLPLCSYFLLYFPWTKNTIWCCYEVAVMFWIFNILFFGTKGSKTRKSVIWQWLSGRCVLPTEW